MKIRNREGDRRSFLILGFSIVVGERERNWRSELGKVFFTLNGTLVINCWWPICKLTNIFDFDFFLYRAAAR